METTAPLAQTEEQPAALALNGAASSSSLPAAAGVSAAADAEPAAPNSPERNNGGEPVTAGAALAAGLGETAKASSAEARKSAASAKGEAEQRRPNHGVLEKVVDALEHINSPTSVRPPGAPAASPPAAASPHAEGPSTPAVAKARSKKLHFGSSHQAYTGIDEWLDNYEIDLKDLGPNFRSGKLTNAQNLDLATYTWTQDTFSHVKGAVVLFHSYTSHALWDFMRHQPTAQAVVSQVDTLTGEKETVDMLSWVPIYNGSWVEAFWNLGFNVYAIDHQSHGRSAGWREWRCNVETFDHLVDDAVLFIKSVVAADPMTPDSVPIYVLGYSMGGNITIQTLARIFADQSEEGKQLQSRVKAAVLLAPMLRILFDRKTEFLAKINRHIISCCVPNLRLGRSSGDEAYAYLDRWYEKDPYAYSGSAKSRMIANLYSATLKTKKLMKTLPEHLRVLCLQGTADATVDHRAALLLAKTPVRLDLMYLTGWSHYLAKQIGFELLRDLVAAWVHAKLQVDTAVPAHRDSLESWAAESTNPRDRVADMGTQTSVTLPPPIRTVSDKPAGAPFDAATTSDAQNLEVSRSTSQVMTSQDSGREAVA
ncbi:putative phospholipase [Toxoplasma gondii MAS]|uniref:Putative phospholipase n=2 Tax=Toxoplasma gondii TaxID=5811 RepID=A0A086Q381_TOXGO|nr:putative phospholipase [Toxoplasma gondii MAS]PUA85985.1 putative phospholipase [Toxoplasma gondii TgCATBr9]